MVTLPTSHRKTVPVQNKLLASLPPLEFERLQPHLRAVRLSVGEAIYENDHLLHGVYSLTAAWYHMFSHRKKARMSKWASWVAKARSAPSLC
jgi:hypothetical protein